MIAISFIAGTHGNFLEFVLNKLLYGDAIDMVSPLSVNGLGTSHSQRSNLSYQSNRHFVNWSWPVYKNKIDEYDRIVKIDFNEYDLLTVIQLNLKRGEDFNIDPDTIEENTYFKLQNKFGSEGKNGNGPNKIIDCILKYSEIESYNNIKASSWPIISSAEEFYNLPKHIIEESINVFGVEPLVFNDKHPHCPKYILRDIFKTWFYENTFYTTNKEFDKIYNERKQIYKINLRMLYDKDLFIEELNKIEKFFNLKFNYNFLNFHNEFIDRVPYKDSLFRCRKIIDSLKTKEDFNINLNVIEEAYLNYILETEFNVKSVFLQKEFFKTTEELRQYVTQN